MLYEFKSKAGGTVVMTQPVAESLLAIIGKPPGRAGVFEAEHLPAAIAALNGAIAQEKARSQPGSRDDEDDPSVDPEKRIGLAQRAWPLIDLFKQAAAASQRVTWGV